MEIVITVLGFKMLFLFSNKPESCHCPFPAVIEEWLHSFLILVLKGGDWLGSGSGCLTLDRRPKHPLGGFGGLVVSVLASGTQDRGFEPGLPSEGK
jgi:hypothetical protein